MRRRIQVSNTLTDRGQLGLCRLERSVRREPPEDTDGWPFTRRRAGQPQRQPELLTDRKAKPLRHNANDGRGRATHSYRLTNDAVIAIETILPDVVADHDDISGAR